MSLLRRIQDATHDPGFQLADVLLMCKILAARLDHLAFKDWLEQELNTYRNRENLPDYRVLKGLGCRGDFFGPFGSGMKNAPIPMLSLPEWFREDISTYYVQQSVSAIENIVNQARQSNTAIIRSFWNADAVAVLGRNIQERMACGQAWIDIPTYAFVTILHTVKSRILDFVLAIEAEAPDAGEAEPGEKPLPEGVINLFFDRCILHQNNQTALSGAVIQIHNQVTHMSENYVNHLQRANIANMANTVKDNAQQNAYNFSQSIGQNADDISGLISSLREKSQEFPEIQREEAIVHLDDLQEDITTPEKQKPQRIKVRLAALLAIAGTLGGVAENSVDFSNKVLDLSKKLGFPIEVVQPQSKQLL